MSRFTTLSIFSIVGLTVFATYALLSSRPQARPEPGSPFVAAAQVYSAPAMATVTFDNNPNAIHALGAVAHRAAH